MTEEKRVVKQENPQDQLICSGAVINLTGTDLKMPLNDRTGSWTTFKAAEKMKPVTVATGLPDATMDELCEELRILGVAMTALPGPIVGIGGAAERVGTLNEIFRLVRPEDLRDRLKRLQDGITKKKVSPLVRLMDLPNATAASKRRGVAQYYVVRCDVAYFAAMKGTTREEELAHWLVPAEPLEDERGEVLAFRSFMPASFLKFDDAEA